jgi:putative transposase
MLIYEYKLRGKPKQFKAVDEAIRTVQFIRNKAVRYWVDNKGVGKYALSGLSKTLSKEFDFADKLNSQARQAACERAWSSISRFYDACKKNKPGKKGFPKFQKDNRSVEYKVTGWKLSDDCRFVTFTDKHGIGRLKLVGKQILNAFKDKIKRVQIVRRADGYYANFVLDVDRAEHMAATGSLVGLDMGLTHIWTDSNGQKKENPRKLKAAEKALKRSQRKLSRKQKGSQNRKKAIKTLGRKHLKVSRQRKDFAIKAARALYQSHDLIVLEDLKVRNMVKNHRLAKAISDAGWYQLRTWIEYFGQVFSKVCVTVPPEYTTQECHACGRREPKALSLRWHSCPCGCEMDRDENSALVILNRGLKKLAKSTAGHAETGETPTPVDR